MVETRERYSTEEVISLRLTKLPLWPFLHKYQTLKYNGALECVYFTPWPRCAARASSTNIYIRYIRCSKHSERWSAWSAETVDQSLIFWSPSETPGWSSSLPRRMSVMLRFTNFRAAKVICTYWCHSRAAEWKCQHWEGDRDIAF